VAAVVEQLEGFELAATAWERDVLPARVADYGAELLDRLCFSGRVVWGRLTPGTKAPLRTSPIALLLDRKHRGQLRFGQHVAMRHADLIQQLVLHRLRRGGTSDLWLATIDVRYFPAVEVCRKQRVRLGERISDYRRVQLPIPPFLPAQRDRKIARRFASGNSHLYLIHGLLLIRVQHFQQQAAGLAPLCQRLQQPALQGVMIGIVVALANEHPFGFAQFIHELFRGDLLTGSQVDDLASLGM